MKLSPLPILNAYYITGICLAIFGPISYQGIDGYAIGSYMAAFIVLVSVTFLLGTSGTAATNARPERNPSGMPWYATLTLLLSLGYTLALLVMALSKDGLSAVSLSAGAENYAESYEQYDRNAGNYSLSWIVSESFYPLHIAAIAWTVFFFGRMGWLMRGLSLIACALILLTLGVMAGKQKIIGDAIIVTAFVSLAAWYRRKISVLQIVTLGIGLLIAVSAILSTLANRYALAGISIDNINEKSNPLVWFNEDSSVLVLFGPDIGFTLMQFSGYLSQGYYGLSLAMSLPFQWTGMIGNSYSMMVIYDRFLGGEFFLDRTYPFRAGEEYGWGLEKWHTAFSWYASDFTFTGTLFFMAGVAFVYGRLWRDVAMRRNPRAVPLFAYLSIGFLFVPANNQLLISPGGVLTLLLYAALWLWPSRNSSLRLRPQPATQSP